MKTLVAIGCSHMAGAELDGENPVSEYNRKHCFAAQLANKLGYKCINVSVNGASNQFIHRKVVEYIAHYMENPQDVFFLIGWTASPRMELRYAEENNFKYENLAELADEKYFPFTSGTDSKLILDNKMKKLNKFIEILFDFHLKENERATLAYSTQQILKSLNIPYFMINTCNGIERTEYTTPIIDKLDTKCYYKPNEEMYAYFPYCRKVLGHKKFGKYWHHFKPAHDEYTKFLYKILQEREII